MGFVLAPVLFFSVGFLFGWVGGSIFLPLTRVLLAVVLWSPIVVLLLLQRAEVVPPDTLSTISIFLPRVIELPVLGFLVGYSVTTVLAVVWQQGRVG